MSPNNFYYYLPDKKIYLFAALWSVAAVLLVVNQSWAEGQPTIDPASKNLTFITNQKLDQPEKLQQWIDKELSEKLGLDDRSSLNVDSDSSSLGTAKIIVIEQMHNQLPVVGLESRLTLDDEDKPQALLGKHQGFSQQYSTETSISELQALNHAQHVQGTEYSSRIAYWSEDYKTLTLAYELQGFFGADEENIQAQIIYIDANTGAVLEKYSSVHSSKQRKVSSFQQACRRLNVFLPVPHLVSRQLEVLSAQTYSRTESDSPSSDAGVEDAFKILGDGYDFITQVIGMDSIDDQGLTLHMQYDVHYHTLFQGPQCVGDVFNASWYGPNQTLYVPRSALPYTEIVLHELGHGIVSNGSNLVYQFESGALNESIADAIGVSFRAWLEYGKRSINTEKLPREIWQLRSPSYVMRDLADPRSIDGRGAIFPDHYSNRLNWPSSKDGGGVHYNSSIMNLAFYLLASGGKHPRISNDINVTGIGILKAVKIYAQAGAKLLTSRANFEDARFAFATAAELLYGKNSQEWVSVHQAMDAVGVSGQWIKPKENPKPVITPEPKPQSEEQSEEQPKKEVEKPAIKKEPQTVPIPESKTEPESEPEPTVPKQPLPDQEKDSNKNQQNSNLIVFALLTAAGLLILGALLVKMRPNYGKTVTSPVPQSPEPLEYSAQHSQDRANNSLQVVRPVLADHPIRYRLLSTESSIELILPSELLCSSEGVVIGRASDLCHIQIISNVVSRRHLRFRLKSQQLFIEDLNSSHGTYIDGSAIAPFNIVLINSGQNIRVADLDFALRY